MKFSNWKKILYFQSDFKFIKYMIIICEWISWFHDLTIFFFSITVHNDTLKSLTSLSRHEETVLKENHNIKWVSYILYILIIKLIANIWSSMIKRKYYIFSANNYLLLNVYLLLDKKKEFTDIMKLYHSWNWEW